MCTSNTLMKIDTRVYSPSARPSGAARARGGGGTLAIIVISPSAGATINLSPRGVVRIGSRKKAATQIVRPTSSQPMNVPAEQEGEERERRRDRRRTCGLPGWTEGKRHLTVVVSGLSGLSRAGMRHSLSTALHALHNAAVA